MPGPLGQSLAVRPLHKKSLRGQLDFTPDPLMIEGVGKKHFFYLCVLLRYNIMPLRPRSVMVDRCARRVCNFFGVAGSIGRIFATVNFFHKLVTSSINGGSSKIRVSDLISAILVAR